MRLSVIAGILIAVYGIPLATAQTCVAPTPWYDAGYPSTFPKPGWRYRFNTQWVTMQSGSSLPFIFCNTTIGASNCVYYDAGDQLFTAAQKNEIRGAFAEWNTFSNSSGTNAGFLFYEGAASSFNAGVYWEVRRVNVTGMPGALGITQGIHVDVDTNNDGVSDTRRRHVMSTDLISTATGNPFLKALMAHEIGHGMALDDCSSCGKYGSIMYESSVLNDSDPLQLVAPTTCDANVTRQTAFP